MKSAGSSDDIYTKIRIKRHKFHIIFFLRILGPILKTSQYSWSKNWPWIRQMQNFLYREQYVSKISFRIRSQWIFKSFLTLFSITGKKQNGQLFQLKILKFFFDSHMLSILGQLIMQMSFHIFRSHKFSLKISCHL